MPEFIGSGSGPRRCRRVDGHRHRDREQPASAEDRAARRLTGSLWLGQKAGPPVPRRRPLQFERVMRIWNATRCVEMPSQPAKRIVTIAFRRSSARRRFRPGVRPNASQAGVLETRPGRHVRPPNVCRCRHARATPQPVASVATLPHAADRRTPSKLRDPTERRRKNGPARWERRPKFGSRERRRTGRGRMRRECPRTVRAADRDNCVISGGPRDRLLMLQRCSSSPRRMPPPSAPSTSSAAHGHRKTPDPARQYSLLSSYASSKVTLPAPVPVLADADVAIAVTDTANMAASRIIRNMGYLLILHSDA